MIHVRTSPGLLKHLREHESDGTTVEEALFGGGRLQYPGRREIERQLGFADPYTLELEARVIEGLDRRTSASIRFLSRIATERALRDQELDPALHLLWETHSSYRGEWANPSLDRLVAALVQIEEVREHREAGDLVASTLAEAAATLVSHMHIMGLPPTREGLEEIFDGAPPACVGLGLVEL